MMKSMINGRQWKRGDDEECPKQLCLGLGTADMLANHGLPSPPWFEDPRFGPLATASALSSAAISLASRLLEVGNKMDHAAAANIITEALVGRAAEILRITRSEVDRSQLLYSYSVNSLVSPELKNWITREIKANIAILDILAAVLIESLRAEIAQKSKLVMELASS